MSILDPTGYYGGIDEREEVANANFDYFSTPKLGQSQRFIMFVPNVMGCRTTLKDGRRITLSKNSYGRYYEKFGDNQRLPDQFVVAVGILDESMKHFSVASPKRGRRTASISYGLLLDILQIYGYDPLRPIRKPEFISKWEKILGEELIKCLDRSRRMSTPDIRARLAKVGERIRDICVQYILGGEKPPLNPKTKYVRAWKEEHYPKAIYPGDTGINEPLSESGQLATAIQVSVEAYRSQARDDFFKERKKMRDEATKRYKERLAKKRKERADAKEARLRRESEQDKKLQKDSRDFRKKWGLDEDKKKKPKESFDELMKKAEADVIGLYRTEAIHKQRVESGVFMTSDENRIYRNTAANYRQSIIRYHHRMKTEFGVNLSDEIGKRWDVDLIEDFLSGIGRSEQ